MATFYVLPSRHLFGQRFGDLLASLFPGMTSAASDWADLAESLTAIVAGRLDGCVVYREELDEEVSVKDSLMRDFGAELSDEIIEIHLGASLHQIVHQRWATESPRQAA